MARYIVGLNEHIGYQFYNEIVNFCLAVQQRADDEVVLTMYRECVAQVLSIYDNDPSMFTANIYMLPNWKTLLYVDEAARDISQPKKVFQENIRIFALRLYLHLKENIGPLPDFSSYIMETASVTTVMVSVVSDAGLY